MSSSQGKKKVHSQGTKILEKSVFQLAARELELTNTPKEKQIQVNPYKLLLNERAQKKYPASYCVSGDQNVLRELL